ncbi:plasmid recombination protein [Glaciimonas sp. PAMC28666]|uniref:plasmid recombination protein n=1 Tax=Glaciimonas sp. PAMC28666 TaxID=2807626 RepID=UPI001962BBD7|nr:plasmid recombination protein [Glaciimonas sp. PAMC28666]QRX84269.1 plasmid recombination protein [Glaciimonas sp. PAMC28666]
MTHAQFLRIKKLTGKAIIQVAARHNHREIVAELGAGSDSHIDPARTCANIVLSGPESASGVAALAQGLLDNSGVKALRKDAVRGLEIIISLPPESSIDHLRFFVDATRWIERYFEAPVISAIIHNDEAAPHCHVLLLPLVHGRMVGSDLMGGRAKLLDMQANFHAQVGQRHGLTRQASQKRLSPAIQRQAIDSAFDVLKANSGLNSTLLRVLLEAHLHNPERLLLAMGLDMPKPKVKGTFAGIMTKPCKPEKPIGFGKKKPIGFDDVAAPEKEQTLSCVGFGISAQPISPVIELHSATMNRNATVAPEPQPTDTAEGDYVRERDDDKAAVYWDESRGEFIKQTVKASCKPSIIASVRVALETIERHGSIPVMRC